MNYLDIVILIPVLYFGFNGLRKGLIKELSSLAALVLGIYAALYWNSFAYQYLTAHQITSKYIMPLSFALTFIAVVVFVHLIGKLLDKLIKVIALGMVNRLLGMLFGFLKAGVLLFFAVYLLHYTEQFFPLIPADVKSNSLLFSVVTDLFKQLPSITTDFSFR
ncbi:MAG: CvpA family protein [Bacteroidetes bacterium]|nr:MAG: CvpA family protein [Bacteroidota bacterium]